MNSPVLDTLIAIVFTYMLFSILASMLNELYVSIREQRGGFLKKSIDELLNDNLNYNFSTLLYSHPIIDGTKRDHNRLPSYISASNFSLALVDEIGRLSDNAGLVPDEGRAGSNLLKLRLDHADTGLQRFLKGLDKLNESDLKVALRALADRSADTEQLHRHVQQWFNDYMDRTSGWYKIIQRKRLFFIGILIAIGMNVDSIALIKAFYSNEVMRHAVVAAAVQYVQATPDGPPAAAQQAGDVKKQIEAVRQQYRKIGLMKLPIGWPVSKKVLTKRMAVFFCGDHFWKSLLGVLGWFITAAMISFGAPFWFNALSKLVNVRSTGDKPGK